MKFYSVQIREHIEIDDKEIVVKTLKNGRKAATASKEIKGQKVNLFRILGKEDLKRLEVN